MTSQTPDYQELAAQIRELARELGFQQLGIGAVDLGEHEQHLQHWLDAGYHGEMEWMASHGSKRTHPDELVPGTQRVLSVRMDYLPTDIIRAPQISNIDWWMRKIGGNSSASHSIKRAVSIEPKISR